MRKISLEVAEAFKAGRSQKFGNTAVKINMFGDLTVELFGNDIARNNFITGLEYNICGYPTATTRDRLAALTGGHVSFAKGECRINGIEVPVNGWFKMPPTSWETVEIKGY